MELNISQDQEWALSKVLNVMIGNVEKKKVADANYLLAKKKKNLTIASSFGWDVKLRSCVLCNAC